MNDLDTNRKLQQLWEERVRTKNYSPAVLGLGTVRVMGRSGDTPLSFPRITSLAALETLSEEERYALRTVQTIVEEAPRESRTVLAVSAPVHNELPSPRPVTRFDPTLSEIIVVARIAGG